MERTPYPVTVPYEKIPASPTTGSVTGLDNGEVHRRRVRSRGVEGREGSSSCFPTWTSISASSASSASSSSCSVIRREGMGRGETRGVSGRKGVPVRIVGSGYGSCRWVRVTLWRGEGWVSSGFKVGVLWVLVGSAGCTG